jgi:hypothetical protein
MWNRVGILGLCALMASCPKPVDQDINSGEDAWYKGAPTIELDKDGEGEVVDRVTYPGGDRVDWHRIDLPDGYRGLLKVKIKFTTPRPGLDVAYIVYDRDFRRKGRAKPAPKRRQRTKKVRVPDAEGRYYVQVYAPRREDAADYVLSIEYEGVAVDDGGSGDDDDDDGYDVDDPPVLPAVDPGLYADAGVGKPRPDAAPIPDAAPPDAAPILIDGKIVNRSKASAGRVVITINRGSSYGIKRGWKGHVLSGSTMQPLPGGDFVVKKVTRSECEARVTLTVQQVDSNKRVQIWP